MLTTHISELFHKIKQKMTYINKIPHKKSIQSPHRVLDNKKGFLGLLGLNPNGSIPMFLFLLKANIPLHSLHNLESKFPRYLLLLFPLHLLQSKRPLKELETLVLIFFNKSKQDLFFPSSPHSTATSPRGLGEAPNSAPPTRGGIPSGCGPF